TVRTRRTYVDSGTARPLSVHQHDLPLLVAAAVVRPLDDVGAVRKGPPGDVHQLAGGPVAQFVEPPPGVDELPVLAGPASVRPLLDRHAVACRTNGHPNDKPPL